MYPGSDHGGRNGFSPVQHRPADLALASDPAGRGARALQGQNQGARQGHGGRIGNDWLNVPVLVNTEFGNGNDSMIGWKRRRNGGLAFDYTVLDRYLDVAVKDMETPRVVQLAVIQGMRSSPAPPAPPEAEDPGRGQRPLRPPDRRRSRRHEGEPKARASERCTAPGVECVRPVPSRPYEGPQAAQAMFWGYPLEHEADPLLKAQLAREHEEGAHAGTVPD